MRHSYIDEYSQINSFIHRLDPRIKIIAFIAFIIFIIFTRPDSFMVFALYSALIAILILLSKIPVKFILKRSLVIIPFVLMISIFIPFIKEGEVAGGYSFGVLKLTITYSGLMIFWNVLIKAYLSALCMILLVSSSKFSDFLKALEKLKISRIITMVLSFMYRYIFVFQDELLKMKQAKESRSVGGSRWLHFKTLANMIGVLFIRGYERAESVYLAMRSRGFDGQVKTINDFQLTKKDLFFLLVITASLISIMLLGK